MKPRKDLLEIATLEDEEIEFILDNAAPFKQMFTRSVKKVPNLRGRTVLSLFYEASTRTSSSFEVAAKRVSADVIALDVPHSSVSKGESVLDTVDTLQAMKADYIVIRHGESGIPHLIAKHTHASVINAGDGQHAHPTQGLLDAFTFREAFPKMSGRKALIVGDLLHSRVARSTSMIFRRLGVEVGVLGPGTLVPPNRPEALRRFKTWDEALAWGPDVVYLLRIQMERQKVQYFPSLGEYHKVYGMTDDRLKQIRERGIFVMHPGPVNRGVELTDEVMNYERCLINRQVENGIAVRMAVLYWLRPDAPPVEAPLT